MKIGIDIMGGDFAPQSTVLGAIEAYKSLKSETQLVLIGDKDQVLPLMKEQDFNPDVFEYIHTTEVIGMAEHPTKAITQKPNSSISVGFQMLKEQKIQAFSSAGNTGAMLVGAMFSVKSIPGVLRPGIASVLPKLKGGCGVLLDVGANADCKPEVLVQFGILGSIYAQNMYQIQQPKVALINIGEEEEKGNNTALQTYPLMQACDKIQFVGNVEGRDLFNDAADVIVTDGFTGNIMLKLAESFYVITLKKGLKDEFFDRFNYENYGGSPILGVNAPVIIGHGISSPTAIKNMILQSEMMVSTQIIDKFKESFNTPNHE